jgi:hypothetical protein
MMKTHLLKNRNGFPETLAGIFFDPKGGVDGMELLNVLDFFVARE